MSGSSCVIFVPDDTGKTGLSEPLMLRAVAGAPVLRWLAHDLADEGFSRVFLVCHERYLDAARKCFPSDVRLTVSGNDDPADLLHVFLSTDEEEAEQLLVITGPALYSKTPPAGIVPKGTPSAALLVNRDALMQAIDEDFHFAIFLREYGLVADAEKHLHSVTSAAQLNHWQPLLRAQVLDTLANQGVEIYDPTNCYIEPTVRIGRGAVLLPGTILRGETVIGDRCVIGPNSLIENSRVGDDTTVNASQVYASTIGRAATVGPFAYIRPNCTIGDRVKVGDFVELKNSVIGTGTKVPHLSYVGDSDVGERVNFGCGSVTVNYDRARKHRTTIGSDAFIGCNANLIAPLTLGAGSYIGAGSTITDDVPDQALGIARARQANKKEWAAKHKLKEP